MEHANSSTEPGVRFGRTLIVTVHGDPFAQGADGVVVAANRRGMMGAAAVPGIAGLRSFGGSDLERAAMALAPLDLGSAVVTDAPGLGERGVRVVIHAVVHQELGDRAREEHVRRATGATLLAADRHRLRHLAMPVLGLAGHPADPGPMIEAVVGELVASLRRSSLRIEQVTLACRFPEQAEATAAAVRRSRERAWPTRG